MRALIGATCHWPMGSYLRLVVLVIVLAVAASGLTAALLLIKA